MSPLTSGISVQVAVGAVASRRLGLLPPPPDAVTLVAVLGGRHRIGPSLLRDTPSHALHSLAGDAKETLRMGQEGWLNATPTYVELLAFPFYSSCGAVLHLRGLDATEWHPAPIAHRPRFEYLISG